MLSADETDDSEDRGSVSQPVLPPLEAVTQPIWHRLLEAKVAVPLYVATVAAIIALGVDSFCTYMRVATTYDGIHKLMSGDAKAALTAFNRVVQQTSGNSYGYYFRGITRAELNQFPEAVLDLDASQTKGQPRDRVLVTRAAEQARANNYDKAIEDCTVLLARDPQNLNALKIRAVSYLHRNQFQLAADDCTSALEICKDSYSEARLYRARGFAESQMHHWEAAIQDLTQAIGDSPSQWAYLQRGDCYRNYKLFDKALEDYSAVLLLNPQSYRAFVARGICERNLGQNDKALRDLDDSLALNPKGVESFMQRGELHMSQQEWQAAADDFDQAGRLNPFVKEPGQKKSLALKHLKDTHRLLVAIPAAAIVSGPAVELPKDMKSLLNLGYRYMNEGSFDEAIICYSEAVGREPNNPMARKYLAYAFLQRHEPAAAVTQFQALNRLQPLDMRDTFTLGRCLAASGQAKNAIILLNRLYKQGHMLEAKAEIARIFLDTGNVEKAALLGEEGIAKAKTPSERQMFEEILMAVRKPAVHGVAGTKSP